MEERPVRPGPGLVHHAGLEVHEDGPGHVLAMPSLLEEGGEAVVPGLAGVDNVDICIVDIIDISGHVPGVGGHGAVRHDAVLEAVQLPARVAHLDPGLAHVHRQALPSLGRYVDIWQ